MRVMPRRPPATASATRAIRVSVLPELAGPMRTLIIRLRIIGESHGADNTESSSYFAKLISQGALIDHLKGGDVTFLFGPKEKSIWMNARSRRLSWRRW